MHPAVETILSRMKSHPDEFVNSGKWTQAIGDYKKWFTKEELDAVNEGLRGLRMGQFQERIFKILTDDTLDQTIEDNSAFGMAPMKMSGRPVNYGLTTSATGTSSILGGTGATTLSSVSQIAAQQHIDSLKEEIRRMRIQQKIDLGTDLFKELPDE